MSESCPEYCGNLLSSVACLETVEGKAYRKGVVAQKVPNPRPEPDTVTDEFQDINGEEEHQCNCDAHEPINWPFVLEFSNEQLNSLDYRLDQPRAAVKGNMCTYCSKLYRHKRRKID